MPGIGTGSPDGGGRGLAFPSATASTSKPRYLEADHIAPIRSIGLNAKTTLKATFWEAKVAETPQAGDPDFVSIALNTGGGRVWRNHENTPTDVGAIAMQPFEGAHWRFERQVSFVHLYVPFTLLGGVCESLFERELAHAELRMPSATRDDRLCQAANTVHRVLASTEPTNLLLDSWALILSEIVVRRFSSHAERRPRLAGGKIPTRGVAHVIDYIESTIGEDLKLETLANIAGMSVYHFARGFKDAVGQSPHAYVLSRRISRAQQMLRQGKVSLANIAAACGFSSQAHFTTAFGRDLGVTPGEYRRSILP